MDVKAGFSCSLKKDKFYRTALLLLRFNILMLMIQGCTENIFRSLGDPDSEAARLVEAEKALNDRDYVRAIALYDGLSPETQGQRDILLKRASAHSGRCGLDFLQLSEVLVDVSADSVLQLLFEAFPGSDADSLEGCQRSRDLLRGIGNESIRSIDENLLTAFNSMATIGNLLSLGADQNNDGIEDSSFDHCDASLLSDDQVDDVGSSIALILNSFTGIGEDFADVDSFREQCQSFPGFSRVCTLEDGGFNASELSLIRSFIGSSDFGLGSCDNLVSVSCVCP